MQADPPRHPLHHGLGDFNPLIEALFYAGNDGEVSTNLQTFISIL